MVAAVDSLAGERRPREALLKLLRSRLGARLVLEPCVLLSYRWYLRTGRTPGLGYAAMRKLFGSARSSRFEVLVSRSAREHRPIVVNDPTGVIADPVAEVLAALRRDGAVVLSSRLPQQLVKGLLLVAQQASCRLVGPADGAPARARFDRNRPQAIRYDLDEADIVRSDAAQALIADRSLLAVSQAYLESTPVQDLVSMWWTTPSASGSSAAAQQFHFDLDRLRFIKLFVYLTDVKPENGPHVYVRGSHRDLPEPLRADRRYADDEVLAHYDSEDLLHITGPSGTMFLADTRGLHKGLHVAEGARLVFQLEYASSLFGAPAPQVGVSEPTDALTSAIRAFPATYRRFSPLR